MNKNKASIPQRITCLFTKHPWLKLISLALAIIVWLYARGEMARFINF
ncbi:MAG: hypothetical protein ABSE81_01350 [Candidatus Omnitrophota bacterium]